MKTLTAILLIALGWPLGADAEPAEGPAIFGACSANEKWDFPASWKKAAPQLFVEELELFLAGGMSPFQAIEKAETYRNETKDPRFELVGNYWFARAIYQAGGLGLAALWFNRMVSDAPEGEDLPTPFISLAAIRCLEEIHAREKMLPLSDEVVTKLPALLAGIPAGKEGLRGDALRALFLYELSHPPEKPVAPSTLERLKGREPDESYARALLALRNKDAEKAATYFSAVLKSSPLPVELEAKRDSLRLALARARYEKGQYAEALAEFSRVSREANELPDALIGQAWSHLQLGDSARAIGTALGMQTGGMGKTFAPESLQIAAIAFNELCLYHESRQALRVMRESYAPVQLWLKRYAETPVEKRPALYPLMVSFLRDGKPGAPRRILGEWLRSPFIHLLQERINFAMEEPHRAVELAHRARREDAKEYPGSGGASEGAALKAVLEDYGKTLVQRRRELAKSIETELVSTTFRMQKRLAAVLDNSLLVEGSVLNAASADMVWQSAHPEYQAWSRDEEKKARAAVRRGVDWNTAGEYRLGNTRTELWEDELGELSAVVVNTCASRDRFLRHTPRKREK
jgi:tetratricopeptide (TPR) repeat protein